MQQERAEAAAWRNEAAKLFDAMKRATWGTSTHDVIFALVHGRRYRTREELAEELSTHWRWVQDRPPFGPTASTCARRTHNPI